MFVHEVDCYVDGVRGRWRCGRLYDYPGLVVLENGHGSSRPVDFGGDAREVVLGLREAHGQCEYGFSCLLVAASPFNMGKIRAI